MAPPKPRTPSPKKSGTTQNSRRGSVASRRVSLFTNKEVKYPPFAPAESHHNTPSDLSRAIQEENKRMLARIHNLERDGNRADYTYDPQGRIILLNPPSNIPFIAK